MKSVFQLSVFTDEISQDFAHALEVASQEFRLDYVELRAMWGKNIVSLDAREIAEARRLLQRFGLRVTSIAGPLFKVDWPDAPRSQFSPQRDQFSADFTFAQQPEVLEREIELARVFQTHHVRCFDYWRLDDPAPHRAAMDRTLLDAATACGKHGLTLVMENEYACNTATASEAVRTLTSVDSPYFKLNWDPGNSAKRGEEAYPAGYQKIPVKRIGHVHCKDVAPQPDGTLGWMAMGTGTIDYVGQFQALKRDGYRGPVVLETHWRGGLTPEEATRRSFAGMRDQLRRAGAL